MIARVQCARGNACENAGKHPRIKSWPTQASTDPDVISEWWRRWPNAGVGLVTGERSGLVVLDIDPRHDGDESRVQLVERFGPLPDTVTQLTGGGGEHLFFQADPDRRIRSAAPAFGSRYPGVDTRADGGFVLVQPTVHASGRRYTWELSSSPWNVPLAPLPDTWREALIVVSPPSPPTAPSLADATRIVEGARNTSLTSLAGAMRRHGADEQTVATALLDHNEKNCLPPLDCGRGAAHRAIDPPLSALRRGSRHSR